METRQQFTLLEGDQHFLDNEWQLPWEALVNGRSKWILIHQFQLPEGYNHKQVTVAIQIPPTYPTSQLDMVYVYPPLARLDGKVIPQTTAKQPVDGKSFQRWSRHRTSKNPWKPGVDSIETHVYLIADWFEREF